MHCLLLLVVRCALFVVVGRCWLLVLACVVCVVRCRLSVLAFRCYCHVLVMVGLYGVYYVLFVGRCVLFVACYVCLLFVVFCRLFVVCSLWLVVGGCELSFACLLFVDR